MKLMEKVFSKYKEVLYFGLSLVIISLGLGIWRTINEVTIQRPVTEAVLGRFLEIIPLLGLGFLKLGIGFAIVIIVKNIKATGDSAGQSFKKAGLEIGKPKPPFYARLFPKFLLTGIFIELIAAIVMIPWMIAGVNNTEPLNEILHILAVPIEGLGVAFLIGGIAFGLATIVLNLGSQVTLLPRRLKILVKGEGDSQNLVEIVPKWLIGTTILGMVVSAAGLIPSAIVRAIYYGSQGLPEPVAFALIWDTLIFVGIAIMLFAISFWLLTIIKWLRAQRSALSETVADLTEKEKVPIESELKITKKVPYFAIIGVSWMLVFFFFMTLFNAQLAQPPFGQIIKPGRAISLAILFTGIGLALITIVVNLKLTSFMLPGAFSQIVNIIKGEVSKDELASMTPTKPLSLAPMKHFIGIIIGGFIVLTGSIPFAMLRMINTANGNIQIANTFEHIIGPWVSTGVGIIFLMIGLFFSTIVGYVKARKTIISEGVESCVYYTLEKKK